jgi:hypothetical protein
MKALKIRIVLVATVSSAAVTVLSVIATHADTAVLLAARCCRG